MNPYEEKIVRFFQASNTSLETYIANLKSCNENIRMFTTRKNVLIDTAQSYFDSNDPIKIIRTTLTKEIAYAADEILNLEKNVKIIQKNIDNLQKEMLFVKTHLCPHVDVAHDGFDYHKGTEDYICKLCGSRC